MLPSVTNKRATLLLSWSRRPASPAAATSWIQTPSVTRSRQSTPRDVATLVVADGMSGKHQIAHGAQRPVLPIAEVYAAAFGGSTTTMSTRNTCIRLPSPAGIRLDRMRTYHVKIDRLTW
jgi:hypothetical protein